MSYDGSPSKGLMQTITPTFHDPLANLTAAVEYVKAEYSGDWTDEVVVRPRMAGKVTAIERAIAIAETVKPRPEMAEIMERAMADGGPRYAEGGFVSSPTGRIPTVLRPGEYVMTPEMVRATADRVLGRMGLPFPTELDEMPEPPDDYPEPPQLPCW